MFNAFITSCRKSWQDFRSNQKLNEEGLQKWCKEANVRSVECKFREIVTQSIINAYQNKAASLSLRYLVITNIPAAIGCLERLEKLVIFHNGLQTLPCTIGRLTQLKELNLSKNQLTAIPKEIENLTQLRYFNLSDNHLTSLPAEIGRLIQLKEFHVSRNKLTVLPVEIGRLAKLTCLSLSENLLRCLPTEVGYLEQLREFRLWGNQLAALPAEIGRLSQLRELNLWDNRLTTLPVEIGQLSQLREFKLWDNPLTALPNEIVHLNQDCEIDLTGCPFSAITLQRIQEITLASGYEGPRIFHSICAFYDIDSDQPLETLLNDVYAQSEKEKPPLIHLLTEIETKDIGSLRSWLNRINYIASMRNAGVQRVELSQKITELLELADRDEVYRALFLAGINDASTTCGDRMALSVIHLGIAKQLSCINMTEVPPNQLATLLIRGVWAIKQLENIAREKIATMRMCDEIEVYLAYLIFLREKLELPIDVKEMLYFRCSNLTEKDLDKAYQEVFRNLSDVKQKCNFLITHDLWIHLLRTRFSDQYDEAMQAENPHQALAQLTEQIV